MNSLISEIAATADRAARPYNPASLTNLETAVRYLIQRGLARAALLLEQTQNHYTGVLDPAAAAYNDYMTISFVPQMSLGPDNQGIVRINLNSLGYVPLLRNDGEEMQAGDLHTGIPFIAIYFKGAFHYAGLVNSQLPQGGDGGNGGGNGGPGPSGTVHAAGVAMAHITWDKYYSYDASGAGLGYTIGDGFLYEYTVKFPYGIRAVYQLPSVDDANALTPPWPDPDWVLHGTWNFTQTGSAPAALPQQLVLPGWGYKSGGAIGGSGMTGNFFAYMTWAPNP